MQHDPFMEFQLHEQELARTMSRKALEREARAAGGASAGLSGRFAGLAKSVRSLVSTSSDTTDREPAKGALGRSVEA